MRAGSGNHGKALGGIPGKWAGREVRREGNKVGRAGGSSAGAGSGQARVGYPGSGQGKEVGEEAATGAVGDYWSI